MKVTFFLKCFIGMAERAENERQAARLDERRAELIRRFKTWLIELPYEPNEPSEGLEWKARHSANDIFIRSRLLQLYEHFRGSKYSGIAWLFYELLCSMRQSISLSKRASSLSPLPVPLNYFGCFSAIKIVKNNPF